jgi:hypothetical protein
VADDVDRPNGWEGRYAHGHDGVREYRSRQWAQLGPTVTPVGFATLHDGRADVTVHQIVRDRDGALLSDATVHHVHRLERGQIMHLEISRAEPAAQSRPADHRLRLPHSLRHARLGATSDFPG